MPGAADTASSQVAALEAETAQAVSAAQVAETAAAAAIASAAVLENQVVVAAAEEIRTVENEVAENKDGLKWLTERMTTLEAEQQAMTAQLSAMQESLTAVLTPAPLVEEVSTASPLPTSEGALPSSVVVADLQAAENPAPSSPPPAAPVKERKYRKL